jgi:hypothetical protein
MIFIYITKKNKAEGIKLPDYILFYKVSYEDCNIIQKT